MSNLEILSWSWAITYIISLPGLWMVFKKLGITSWYSVIPIFNFMVLMNYYNLSLWLLLLIFLIPAWMVIIFLVNYKVAKSFDQGIGLAIGLTFWFTKPIFISFLGFGNQEFIGKEGLV